MCVSSPVYPMIIGYVNGARQMLPDPDWKAEDQRGAQLGQVGEITMTVTTKVVICLVRCSKRSPTERKQRIWNQRRNHAQLKKNDKCCTQDVKVQEGTTEKSALLDQF